jgi:hypothetical protein
MFESTIPTRISSTDPVQIQSTMRCTALAATRSRGSATCLLQARDSGLL